MARKRKEPGDDVISRLCAADLDEDEITRLSMSLLFAGHETTVVAIGLGVLPHAGGSRVPSGDPDRDELDRWLIGEFGLGWSNRSKVRQAVLGRQGTSRLFEEAGLSAANDG